MIDASKAYISQAIYVVSNELDKRIRYKQEEAENIFGSFTSSQSQQTNLPDDFDPMQARLIFQAPHKSIAISQNTTQLAMGFDSPEKSIEKQLEIIFKNVEDIHQRIEKFHGKEKLKENALVISLNFPSLKDRATLSNFVHDRFLNLTPIAPVASASVKAGYLVNEKIFLNLEVDCYEKRGGQITNQFGPIDIATLPLLEIGIIVKLDINSKPSLLENNYTNEGPGEIVNLTKNHIPSKVIEMLGLSTQE